VETDAYCAAVVSKDEIQALAHKTKTEWDEALLADKDLKEFERLLQSNSSSDK